MPQSQQFIKVEMRQSCTECKPRDEIPREGRSIKWEVFQGRRMWRPGSSSCFPAKGSLQFHFPTPENNESIPLELPCNFSGPHAEIMLRSFQSRPRKCGPEGGGMGPAANMFQSHRQEPLESKVYRKQISLIPKDTDPNPTATDCLGMVSPSRLLTPPPG